MATPEQEIFNAGIYLCNTILCINVVSFSAKIFDMISNLSHEQDKFIEFYGKGSDLISKAIETRNNNLIMSNNYLQNALTIFTTICNSIQNLSGELMIDSEVIPPLQLVESVVPPLPLVESVVPPLSVEQIDDEIKPKKELLVDLLKRLPTNIPKVQTPASGNCYNETNYAQNNKYMTNHIKSAYISKLFREPELNEKLKEYRKLPSCVKRVVNKNSLFGKDVLYDENGIKGWNDLVFDICLHHDQWKSNVPFYDLTNRYEFNVNFINKSKALVIQKFHHNNPTDTTVKLVRFVEINLK